MCLCECVCVHTYVVHSRQYGLVMDTYVKLSDRYLGASKLLFTYAIKISPLATMFPVPVNNENELLMSWYNYSIFLYYWFRGGHGTQFWPKRLQGKLSEGSWEIFSL